MEARINAAVIIIGVEVVNSSQGSKLSEVWDSTP